MSPKSDKHSVRPLLTPTIIRRISLVVSVIFPLVAAYISITNDTIGFIQLIQSQPSVVFATSCIIIWGFCIVVSARGISGSNGAGHMQSQDRSGWLVEIAYMLAVILPFLVLLGLGAARFLDGNVGQTTMLFLIVGAAGVWLCCFLFAVSDKDHVQQRFERTYSIGQYISLRVLFILPVFLALAVWASRTPISDKIILLTAFLPKSGELGNIKLNETLPELMSTSFKGEDGIRIKQIAYSVHDKGQALSVGRDYRAAIVIWGSYAEKRNNSALVNIRFETPCLDCRMQFFEEWQEKPHNVKAIEGFDFELSVSDELANFSLLALGVVQYRHKDYADSRATFSHIIENQAAFNTLPDRFRSLTYFFRGVATSELEAKSEAVADFTQAVALDPTSAINQIWLGDSLYENGQYLEAIDTYNSAIAAGAIEESEYVFFNRANAYFMASK